MHNLLLSPLSRRRSAVAILSTTVRRRLLPLLSLSPSFSLFSLSLLSIPPPPPLRIRSRRGSASAAVAEGLPSRRGSRYYLVQLLPPPFASLPPPAVFLFPSSLSRSAAAVQAQAAASASSAPHVTGAASRRHSSPGRCLLAELPEDSSRL
ncbi:uncharacterized protein LOC121787101 [Salvia splendens]|uniref:uncharacterized protein LOC121787101 n=1 Tax=Salvia splendens TaxID=180675 RepID=UPI001C25D46B|nr:uncharacterized protein LOC121787101 [Salvia splendens]